MAPGLDTLTFNLLYSTDWTAGLATALNILEADAMMAPSSHGFDERKHEPYSRATIDAAQGASPLLLARNDKVHYSGQITRSPGSINQVLLRATKTLTPDVAAAFDETCSAIVLAVGFEYAVLHERFVGFKQHDMAFLAGYSLKTFSYAAKGPNGIGVRTWFGKALVDGIGRERLELSTGATAVGDGMRLDLVEDPSTTDFDTLLAAHRAAYAPLLDTGMFSDPNSRTAAPRWVKR